MPETVDIGRHATSLLIVVHDLAGQIDKALILYIKCFNQNYIFNMYYRDTDAKVINFFIRRIEITKKEIMHEKCQGLEEGLGIEWRGHPRWKD